jgi:predicted O-methyltransferase YrrM
VALFQVRALLLAYRLHDRFAWDSATRAPDVADLLRLAAGRRTVVELGTATGWTAGSLALADPRRRVHTFDPVVRDHRERYLDLLPTRARERLVLHALPGDQGPARVPERVDFLFIDSTHAREDTVREVEAWREHLARGALVVLHDYGHPEYPGVAEAVGDLGLDGEVRGPAYVWRPR